MNQNQNPTDTLLQYRESMKLLNNALNKACKTGAYTLEEAYLIKVASSNMEKLIELCDNSKKEPHQPHQPPSNVNVNTSN